MRRIYFDQAATSFPKPPEVPEAVYRYMTECGCNISRGSYGGAFEAGEAVYETRELLSELFDGGDPRNAVFTKNVTEALNILIKGLLKPGDHVLVSSMEHNAVMRPLVQMTRQGVSFSRIPCTGQGELLTGQMEALLTERTRAVILTHASNVCGTVMPVREAGRFCRAHGLILIIDAAQTAGILPLSLMKDEIDAIAFTGHKGLLGPQGTGGFVIRPSLAERLEPLLSGGTGSISHTEEIPDFMPDRFEPGTLNLPGIYGLRASLQWLQRTGIDRIRAHELALAERFLDGLAPLEASGVLTVTGLKSTGGRAEAPGGGEMDREEDTALCRRTGVVSVVPCRADGAELADSLDSRYGIMTRVGLHCAPSAHKTLGTYPGGTVRFSFGWYNTEEEVDYALMALRECLWS